MHYDFALVALALAGCAGPLGSHYEVVVDPAFAPDQVEAVAVTATDAWSGATAATFTASVGTCSGVADGVICVHASDAAAIYRIGGPTAAATTRTKRGTGARGDSGGLAGVDGGEVFLDAAHPAAQLAWEAEHEFGHAMGLEHTGAGTLMFAAEPGAAKTVTAADAAQWRGLR
jgi:hypothetical protein